MEEERCDFGSVRATVTETLAAAVAQAASQHPTDRADPVITPDSEKPQEDQQHQQYDSSPHDKGHQGSNIDTQEDAYPPAELHPPQAVPSGAEDLGTCEDNGDQSVSALGGPTSGSEETAVTSGEAPGMEVDGDAGNDGNPPESSEVGVPPNGAVETVAEAAPAESDGLPVEAGEPVAVVDEVGEGAEAESDGKESNDSVCNECGGGGEVVCCDGCVKSYHADCLPVVARPRLRADADDWFCPDCAAAAAAPPPTAVPPAVTVKVPQVSSDHRGSKQNIAPAPPPACPPPTPATPWTPVQSCVPSRRRKTKATEDYETRINVGPNHQVPCLPDFFLARDGDCLSTLADQTLADGAQSQALGPLLVYSPYLMERSKQQCLAERATKSCITSQKDLAEFLIKCSKRWKVRPGWQPFSPEFAYKLLHRANYDPERALRMMDDSAFCFQSVCDPPLRKYENKWKRRDKRGTFPSSPYPPPVVVRGYLNEKQKQLRMGR
ncbi:PHD-finger domain-containing protein, putative [Eimeria brunetti]|uniref:PHD-finger domain-containing protein, putative n=1 Tax=Eimeria brunetti TaxID=51314 RepID=U6LMA8_9EIME|nr:PHD-finger domain-containing protein, putative [Eimeria brunetti]